MALILDYAAIGKSKRKLENLLPFEHPCLDNVINRENKALGFFGPSHQLKKEGLSSQPCPWEVEMTTPILVRKALSWRPTVL
jgi:hypothetical protein